MAEFLIFGPIMIAFKATHVDWTTTAAFWYMPQDLLRLKAPQQD